MSYSELNERYRVWLHKLRPDMVWYERAADIPDGADCIGIGREGKSYRGLGEAQSLRKLVTEKVDQPMLEEIARLKQLDYLELGWPVMARDLAPLAELENLTVLKIEGPRHLADFTPVCALPALTHLFLSSAKHMTGLDWLLPLKDRLVALGVEGSMWTKHPIPSLAPLEGFALEALFLTGTTLEDQDLSPLATMPNLEIFGTALNAPKAQFMALKAEKPELECNWFDEDSWAGVRDPRPRR
ncbi:hypothetical protein [Litorisediminicola beolgyonensis]|uniref:Leucine Rich repeats (2 copies) n=1 Tax=Litorisediminicola beolgyonensis TaxID=1173614 RepID=A0ABW3ZNS2_9RHOB